MPHWSTDLIRRRSRVPAGASAGRREPADRRPVILYEESAGRQLVARCCAQASAAGVGAGMTVAHARALLPDGVVLEPHRPQREQAALEALARWAHRFSPIVALDPPDGLLIDIAGCRRLFGHERRHVHLVAGAVERLGFGARIAAAPTFACARAVARFGANGRIVTGRDQRKALAALPVEALGVGGATIEALREVGLERIGHLLKLPRPALPARFGPGLLRRLDQALGRAPETIDPVRPVAPPVVERVLAGPTTQLEAVVLIVRELLAELARALERRECGARRLELRLDRPDAGPLSVAITLSRPSRNAKHLWSLLEPKVEAINLGWGVERLRLAAPVLGRLVHEDGAWGWSESGPDRKRLDRAFGELVDTLCNRLGPGRVVRVDPAESHLPERTFRLHPATEAQGKEAKDAGPLPGDRPSLLLAEPEPITVIALMPDGPPSWFRWRGTEQRITASAGPERIAAEWWEEGTEKKGTEGLRDRGTEGKRRRAGRFGESYARAYERFMLGRERDGAEEGARIETTQSLSASVPQSLSSRDYFKVQDEHGRWLWIYRVSGRSDWFVHGLWA
jgi:protein ImuB